jgi:integrase
MSRVHVDKGVTLYKPCGCPIWHVDLKARGQRSRFSLRTTSKDHALTLARQIAQETLSDSWGVAIPRDVLFDEFLETYKTQAKIRNAKRTVDLNVAALNTFKQYLQEQFPHKPVFHLSDITPQVLEGFQQYRIANGASPWTVNRNLGTLSTFLGLALRQNCIRYNPVRRIQPLPVIKNRIPKILDPDQIKDLLQRVASPVPCHGRGGKGQGNSRPRQTPLLDLVIFCLNTGARLGEALYLEWSDVDLGNKTVAFRSKPDHLLKDRDERSVKANEDVLAMLQRRKMSCGKQRWVFPSITGGVLSRANALREFKNVVKGTSIAFATFQILRKTFATTCAAAGVPSFILKAMMGHSSVRTTERYYIGGTGGGSYVPPCVG